MRIMLMIVLILVVPIGSPRSSDVIQVDPLRPIDKATLVVVGRLVDIVPERFSITCHDLPGDSADDSSPGLFEYAYNSGVIEVERVLKGEWSDSRVLVAYKAWSRFHGGRKTPYRDYGVADGERHIWALKKSAFLRIHKLEPGDVLPLDSLMVVQERIGEESAK